MSVHPNKIRPIVFKYLDECSEIVDIHVSYIEFHVHHINNNCYKVVFPIQYMTDVWDIKMQKLKSYLKDEFSDLRFRIEKPV